MSFKTNPIIQQTADLVQTKAGYAIAVGVGSTPTWVHTLTELLQLCAVVFAVLVGATTFYINMKTISRQKRNAKKGKK